MQNQNYLLEVIDDKFVLEKLYLVNHKNKILHYPRLIIDD